jgi:chemotaxis signal transduction protein
VTARPVQSSEHLKNLRQAFDDAFSSPPIVKGQDHEDILSVRIAGDPYGIRVCEMSGLVHRQHVTPVPSTDALLRGITAIRGAIIPIYSLAQILGYGEDHEQTRWVSLFGAHEPIGLTFALLEGYVRIHRSDLCVSERTAVTRKHICQAARIGDQVYPVLSLPSIAQTIKGRAGIVGHQVEK